LYRTEVPSPRTPEGCNVSVRTLSVQSKAHTLHPYGVRLILSVALYTLPSCGGHIRSVSWKGAASRIHLRATHEGVLHNKTTSVGPRGINRLYYLVCPGEEKDAVACHRGELFFRVLAQFRRTHTHQLFEGITGTQSASDFVAQQVPSA
jgi:hypothetical protein